jgi:cytochrome c556
LPCGEFIPSFHIQKEVEKMPRGGKRPGAGRPKKDRGKQEFFEDAESYLAAVVRGETPPDSARITAARVLISYQAEKRRAPKKSPSPQKLHERSIRDVERAQTVDFEQKAALIRAKFKKQEG